MLVNRQNFEWNKNSFSEEFKTTINASEFINIWQRITRLDSRTQQSVYRTETSSPESSQASSSHSTLNSDSEVIPPAPKRVCTERPSASAASATIVDQSQSAIHPNPIDDMMLSKRIGMLCM